MNGKRYLIRRTGGSVSAVVLGPGPTGGEASKPLRHVAAHSPTGFECGYGGSGPADLALSILTDHFEEDPAVTRQWGGRAGILHQQFKWDCIATLTLDEGGDAEITGEAIATWLAAPAQVAVLERERFGPDPTAPAPADGQEPPC